VLRRLLLQRGKLLQRCLLLQRRPVRAR